MFNLGFQEILVILLVALIFLGPKMLPDIASTLGKAIREVRKAASDVRNQIELDDAIRKPLQELREATLLPPEELKRRDEVKAAQLKIQREEDARKQAEARPAAETKIETKIDAPKATAPLRDPTLVMNPPPDHNLPPFTPHPGALKPAAQTASPGAPSAADPASINPASNPASPRFAPANAATVVDMAPVPEPTPTVVALMPEPTPTVIAPMPEAQVSSQPPASEVEPAPRLSMSLPVVGLPPPSVTRPGVKVPPPMPLPSWLKKD